MPLVRGALAKPDGTAPASAVVQIRLVASSNDGNAPGFSTTGDLVVVHRSYASVATDGTWSATLRANSLIEQPTGTYYEIAPSIEGKQVTAFNVTVPNGAGPYRVEDILTAVPAAPSVSYATTSYVDSQVAIVPNLVNVKGDLLAATADNTLARVPVGTNEQALLADSTQAAGVKWSAPVPARPSATYPLLKRLFTGTEDCAILSLGDSTVSDVNKYVYLTMQQLAADWPAYTFQWRAWNNTNGSYDAPTTILAGGARTCTIWSGAVSGVGTTYITGVRFPAMVRDIGQVDLVLINHGMNEQAWVNTYFDRYLTLVEMVRHAQPTALIIAAIPNYQTSGASTFLHAPYAKLFGARGLEVFDVASLVAINVGAPAVATADGTHLTLSASTYVASEFVKRFRGYPYMMNLPSLGPSLLDTAAPSIITDSMLSNAALPNWTSSGVTISTDATQVEYRNPSIRLATTTGTGNFYIQYTGTAQQAIALRGDWVSFAVRMWRPSTALATHGILQIQNGVVSVSQEGDAVPNNCWHWQVMSWQVPTNSNTLIFRIFTDVGTSGGDIRIDRVIATRGRFPAGWPLTPA